MIAVAGAPAPQLGDWSPRTADREVLAQLDPEVRNWVLSQFGLQGRRARGGGEGREGRGGGGGMTQPAG